MSNQDNGKETRNPARLAAAIVFVVMLGMGYAISPRIGGAVGLSDPVEDEEISEPMQHLPSECVSGGLVFGDCYLDF